MVKCSLLIILMVVFGGQWSLQASTCTIIRAIAGRRGVHKTDAHGKLIRFAVRLIALQLTIFLMSVPW